MLNQPSRICCWTRTTLFNKIHVVFIITGIFAFAPAMALAVDEDYLKALEVEAEKSAQLGDKKQQKSNKKNTKSILNKKEFIQFEHVLQDSRPATYRFYQKLNDKEKTLVYSIYQKDHKLSRASKTVFDLYFEKNK